MKSIHEIEKRILDKSKLKIYRNKFL